MIIIKIIKIIYTYTYMEDINIFITVQSHSKAMTQLIVDRIGV